MHVSTFKNKRPYKLTYVNIRKPSPEKSIDNPFGLKPSLSPVQCLETEWGRERGGSHPDSIF